ncbi:hypothetical protein cyc_01228 [Cyclospora cayetanensis]|uniref:Uncharacterized protein n=1 Tax=Cyclospora cayetanensis TaxID=88456 RepID=A0A1D3D1V1_9EIME|nr:hypothetical protein cyc_01228 [Cyclospora cayetanensis]
MLLLPSRTRGHRTGGKGSTGDPPPEISTANNLNASAKFLERGAGGCSRLRYGSTGTPAGICGVTPTTQIWGFGAGSRMMSWKIIYRLFSFFPN